MFLDFGCLFGVVSMKWLADFFCWFGCALLLLLWLGASGCLLWWFVACTDWTVWGGAVVFGFRFVCCRCCLLWIIAIWVRFVSVFVGWLFVPLVDLVWFS